MTLTSPLVGLHLSAKTAGLGLPPDLKVKKMSWSCISANGCHKGYKMFKVHSQSISIYENLRSLNIEPKSKIPGVNTESRKGQGHGFINANALTHLSPDKRRNELAEFTRPKPAGWAISMVKVTVNAPRFSFMLYIYTLLSPNHWVFTLMKLN